MDSGRGRGRNRTFATRPLSRARQRAIAGVMNADLLFETMDDNANDITAPTGPAENNQVSPVPAPTENNEVTTADDVPTPAAYTQVAAIPEGSTQVDAAPQGNTQVTTAFSSSLSAGTLALTSNLVSTAVTSDLALTLTTGTPSADNAATETTATASVIRQANGCLDASADDDANEMAVDASADDDANADDKAQHDHIWDKERDLWIHKDVQGHPLSFFDENAKFGSEPGEPKRPHDRKFPVDFGEEPSQHIDHTSGQTLSFSDDEEEEDEAGIEEDAPDDQVVLSSPDDEPTVPETDHQYPHSVLLLPESSGGEPFIPCRVGLIVKIHFKDGWYCGHIQGFDEQHSKWHFTFPEDKDDQEGWLSKDQLEQSVRDGFLFVLGFFKDPFEDDIKLATQNSMISDRDARAKRLAARHETQPSSADGLAEDDGNAQSHASSPVPDTSLAHDSHVSSPVHDSLPPDSSHVSSPIGVSSPPDPLPVSSPAHASHASAPTPSPVVGYAASPSSFSSVAAPARPSRTRARPNYGSPNYEGYGFADDPVTEHATQSTTSEAPHESQPDSDSSEDIDDLQRTPPSDHEPTPPRTKRRKTTHPVPEPDSQPANVSMAPPEPRPPQVQANSQQSIPLQNASHVQAASLAEHDSQESSIHGSIPLSQVSTTPVQPSSQSVCSPGPNPEQYFGHGPAVLETGDEAFEEDDRHRTGLVISREFAVEYSCVRLLFESYADFLAARKAYSRLIGKTALCFCPGCKICDQIDSDEQLKCTNSILSSYRICKTCRNNLPDSGAAKEAVEAFKSAFEGWKAVRGNKATATGRVFRKASAEFQRNPTVATLRALQEARLNYLCDTCLTWSTLCAVQGKNNEEMIRKALNRVATKCPRQFMFLLGTWFTDGTIRNLHAGPHLGFVQCLYNIRLLRSFLISVRECNNVYQRTDFRVTKPDVRIIIDFADADGETRQEYSLFHIDVTKDSTIPLKTIEDIEDFSRRLHLCSHDRWWETTRRERTEASTREFLKRHLGDSPYWDQLEAHPKLLKDLVQTTHSNPIKGICKIAVHSWILILLECFMLGHSHCLSIPNKDVFRCLQQRITFCHRREVMISCLRLFIIGAVAGDGTIMPYPFLAFADKRSGLDSIRWKLAVDPAHSGWLRGMIYKCFGQSMAIHILLRDGKTIADLRSLGGIDVNVCTFQIMRAELEKLFDCTANPESGYDQKIIPFMKYETMAYIAAPTPRQPMHQHFTGITADWVDGVTWKDSTDTNSPISPDSVLKNAKEFYKVLLINRKKGEKLSAYPITVKDTPMIDTSRTRHRRLDADADLIARRELHLKFAELRKAMGHFGLGEDYRDLDFKRCKRFEISMMQEIRTDHNIQLREYHCEEFPDEEYNTLTTVLGEPIFKHLHATQGVVRRKNQSIPERHKDHLPYWETNQERIKRNAEEARATRKPKAEEAQLELVE